MKKRKRIILLEQKLRRLIDSAQTMELLLLGGFQLLSLSVTWSQGYDLTPFSLFCSTLLILIVWSVKNLVSCRGRLQYFKNKLVHRSVWATSEIVDLLWLASLIFYEDYFPAEATEYIGLSIQILGYITFLSLFLFAETTDTPPKEMWEEWEEEKGKNIQHTWPS